MSAKEPLTPPAAQHPPSNSGPDASGWGTAPAAKNAKPYNKSLQQVYDQRDSKPLSERLLLHPGFETACRLTESAATITFISTSLREHASSVLFAIAVGFIGAAHLAFSSITWMGEFNRYTQIRAADQARQDVEAAPGGPLRPRYNYRPADRSLIAKVVIALPVINYVFSPLLEADTPHPSVAISWCSLHTFPQYVICLCYALEGGPLSHYWCVAIAVTTLYTLLGSFHALAVHDHVHGGYWHVFRTCMLWFLPVVLLELVHFFPLLFAYYYYHSISKTLLINYLLVFNAPKALFLLLRVTDDNPREELMQSKFLVWRFPAALIPLLIVPLAPAALTLTHVLGVPNWGSMPEGFVKLLRAKCFAYSWNLLLLAAYLWVAYGGLMHLVLTQQSPGLVVQVSVWATMALTVVVLVQHLTAKLSHFKILPMWRQDGGAVSMYGEFQCRGGVKYSLNQPLEAEDEFIPKGVDLEGKEQC